MEQGMDPVEHPADDAEGHLRTGLDRRTMLKAAVAAGTIAGTWVAPRIQSLGFAPAAAAGTPCDVLSPTGDDKQSQSGQFQCPSPGMCCTQSFGSANNTIKRFTFTNPVANCAEIVVRTVSLNCADNRNPDIGQFGLIIESTNGSGCSVCTIQNAVIFPQSGHMGTPLAINKGGLSCPSLGTPGTGIIASVTNCSDVTSSSRLAVQLHCNVVVGGCTPQG